MSIVNMKKATLAGSVLDKDEILSNLQLLGILHIVPLVESGKKPPLTCDDINEVIKYLSNSAVALPEQKHEADFNADDFVEKCLSNKAEHAKIKERIKSISNYIDAIKDWGNFKVPTIEDLGGYSMHFYKMDSKILKSLEDKEGLTWQVIHKSEDNIYYIVVITKEGVVVKVPGATKVEFGEHSLSEAENDLTTAIYELSVIEKDKYYLSFNLEALQKYKDKLEDKADYKFVSDYSLNREGFFVVHGWVAEKDIKTLKSFAEHYKNALLIEELEEDDNPPTLLQNNTLGAPGEELVKFYQMPSYRMWDPSTVIFLSFSLFFAMIMSDFGYGAVLTAITLLTWKKMSKSETARRIRNMLLMLSGSCLVYGVISGSYFGYEAPIEALKNLHKVNVNDFNAMINLSVGVGAIHIIIANIVRFFKALPKLSSFAFLGWAAIVISGYSLYAIGQDTIWAKNLLIGGVATILLLSSDRPIFSLKGLLLRPIDGLLNLTNITKAFGDCLSYIRLFALGLSSALLASSFNSMAEQAIGMNNIIGTFLGILVFTFGHALNVVLGIMGGLVHGLRLNFIEFSNWALTGEGYQFKPFESKENKKWKI